MLLTIERNFFLYALLIHYCQHLTSLNRKYKKNVNDMKKNLAMCKISLWLKNINVEHKKKERKFNEFVEKSIPDLL